MLKISLPWPAPGLWQNETHRAHWSLTARETRDARAEARVETLRQQPGVKLSPLTGYALGLLFSPPDAKARDLPNAVGAMKAALDGVADALGIDDKWFAPLVSDWGGAERGTVTVIIGATLPEVLREWPLVVESTRSWGDPASLKGSQR